MMDLNPRAMEIALHGLQQQLNAAAAEAHAQGKDFIYEATPKHAVEDPFSTRSLFDKVWQHSIEVRGKMVEAGLQHPEGWVVLRCPQPTDPCPNPRCSHTRESFGRRSTCQFGGCPWGGDF